MWVIFLRAWVEAWGPKFTELRVLIGEGIEAIGTEMDLSDSFIPESFNQENRVPQRQHL